jgi:hypothetical protein
VWVKYVKYKGSVKKASRFSVNSLMIRNGLDDPGFESLQM